MGDYVTVKNSTAQQVISKSRFISFVFCIESDEDAINQLAALRKTYYDSTHICYAYIADDLGNLARFSDDGEPSSTAGLPILEVIKGEGLRHVLVAVVRYFGGVKLGTGGLVAAYSSSAKLGLKAAMRVKVMECNIYKVLLDYNTFYKTEGSLRELALTLECDYADGVQATLAVSVKNDNVKNLIADLTNGKAKIDLLKTDYIRLNNF